MLENFPYGKFSEEQFILYTKALLRQGFLFYIRRGDHWSSDCFFADVQCTPLQAKAVSFVKNPAVPLAFVEIYGIIRLSDKLELDGGFIMAVYDANNLDIEAVGKDGSVELFIISSGKFDDSDEQQILLMDKIENYIGYVLSDEFKRNHPDSLKKQVWIVLSLDKKPSPLLVELCRKIHPWVNSYGINYRVEYKSLFGQRRSLSI